MQRSAEDTKRLQAVLDRVLRGNPYKLDLSGVLRLPGVAPIPLAGSHRKPGERTPEPGPGACCLRDEAAAAAAREDGCRCAQAVRLRPVCRRSFYVCSGQRYPAAIRIRRRPGRPLRSAVDRQYQESPVAGGQSRRAHHVPGTRSHRRRRPQVRCRKGTHRSARQRADDRNAGRRVDERPALHSHFRAGRSRATRFLHRQWTGDDHQCAVRERRRQEDRFAAQYPAEAGRHPGHAGSTCTTCC